MKRSEFYLTWQPLAKLHIMDIFLKRKKDEKLIYKDGNEEKIALSSFLALWAASDREPCKIMDMEC